MSDAAPATRLESPEVQFLLGRSAVYELLALAFAYPSGETCAQLDAFIQDVGEHPIAEAFSLHEPLAPLAAALVEAGAAALAGEHSRLFAGTVLCSAHETEYDFDPFSKARQLADISGFYGAFGLQVSEAHKTLPDFIGTELEFMSLLARKQAFAAVHELGEQQEIAGEAQRAFLRDHLGRWTPRFFDEIASLGDEGHPFYAAAAALSAQFLGAEAALLGAHAEPPPPRIIALEDGEAMACGLDAPSQGDEEELLPVFEVLEREAGERAQGERGASAP